MHWVDISHFVCAKQWERVWIFSFPSIFSVNSLTLSNLKNTNYTVRREIRMAFLASRLPLLPCRLCLHVLEWGALYTVSVMELLLWICKETVMWVNLKLSSFYCLVRQKVIFNSVPCVIHMCSALSAASSICHLYPTWGLGSPSLANGKHTLKIMSAGFAAFQSNFFHWGICAGLFISVEFCFCCLTFIIDIPAINH